MGRGVVELRLILSTLLLILHTLALYSDAALTSRDEDGMSDQRHLISYTNSQACIGRHGSHFLQLFIQSLR